MSGAKRWRQGGAQFVEGRTLAQVEQNVHRGKDGAGSTSSSGIWMKSEGREKSLHCQVVYMHFASSGKALKFHRTSESEDVYLSSYSHFNQYGRNCSPGIMDIMKKKCNQSHVFPIYSSDGDFILLIGASVSRKEVPLF